VYGLPALQVGERPVDRRYVVAKVSKRDVARDAEHAAQLTCQVAMVYTGLYFAIKLPSADGTLALGSVDQFRIPAGLYREIVADVGDSSALVATAIPVLPAVASMDARDEVSLGLQFVAFDTEPIIIIGNPIRRHCSFDKVFQ
jgi:hypothetical protein